MIFTALPFPSVNCEPISLPTKKTKSNRQIIVVTHNANIPVNADAEYIVSMDSETDEIDTKYVGTMDDENVLLKHWTEGYIFSHFRVYMTPLDHPPAKMKLMK